MNNKLIRQNRGLKNALINKENHCREMAVSCLETYVENLREVFEKQLTALRGRIDISDSFDSSDERSYFIGASEQLSNTIKVIDASYDKTVQAIQETAVVKK